jgi:hypothetical protein
MSAEILNGYISENVKITKLADHTTAGTDAVTSAELDMAGFKHVMFCTSFGTAASGNLITMHQGDVSGSVAATVALLTSGTSDEDVILDVKNVVARYLKLVATRGTSSTLESIWAVQYGSDDKAVDNSTSGTGNCATFNAPALA